MKRRQTKQECALGRKLSARRGNLSFVLMIPHSFVLISLFPIHFPGCLSVFLLKQPFRRKVTDTTFLSLKYEKKKHYATNLS